MQTARRSKERTYPELLTARRCKLVVLAIEAGGCWIQETNFVRSLARSRARQAPAILQAAIRVSRSFALLSHAHHNVQPNPCGNPASRLPPQTWILHIWRLATIKQSAIAHLETGQYKNRPKNQRFSQLKRCVRKNKNI